MKSNTHTTRAMSGYDYYLHKKSRHVIQKRFMEFEALDDGIMMGCDSNATLPRSLMSSSFRRSRNRNINNRSSFFPDTDVEDVEEKEVPRRYYFERRQVPAASDNDHDIQFPVTRSVLW